MAPQTILYALFFILLIACGASIWFLRRVRYGFLGSSHAPTPDRATSDESSSGTRNVRCSGFESTMDVSRRRFFTEALAGLAVLVLYRLATRGGDPIRPVDQSMSPRNLNLPRDPNSESAWLSAPHTDTGQHHDIHHSDMTTPHLDIGYNPHTDSPGSHMDMAHTDYNTHTDIPDPPRPTPAPYQDTYQDNVPYDPNHPKHIDHTDHAGSVA